VADLRRLAQASYLGPEDALVMCARYPALLREFEVMLAAGLVRGVDSRDEAGDTALLAAAAGANIRAASLLVDQGANVDAADRRGRRPLTFAIERANPELQGMLLRSGAKMDYVDMDGRSPLMLAVQKGAAAQSCPRQDSGAAGSRGASCGRRGEGGRANAARCAGRWRAGGC
jgi:hypothetical protein